MMQKVLLIPVLSLSLCTSTGQDAVRHSYRLAPFESTHFYYLGNTRIGVQITKYGSSRDIVMINLHDDENTAVKAAKDVLRMTGGTLVTIQNNSKRYITFRKNKQTYTFDPNRIFTREGISKYKKQCGRQAATMINGFAEFCLAKMLPARTIIALHNNEDNGYSLSTYQKHPHVRRDALAVHKSDDHDADNFYLTTDERIYRSLKSAGYNVVLQNNKKVLDDGSLSVYCGKKKKKYINIEAETSKIAEQRKMIEVAVGVISR